MSHTAIFQEEEEATNALPGSMLQEIKREPMSSSPENKGDGSKSCASEPELFGKDVPMAAEVNVKEEESEVESMKESEWS